MPKPKMFGDDFDAKVTAAGIRAKRETVAAGVPVFYRDSASGLDLMEYPDGRRFEIQYVAAAQRENNYRVLREIGKTAA